MNQILSFDNHDYAGFSNGYYNSGKRKNKKIYMLVFILLIIGIFLIIIYIFYHQYSLHQKEQQSNSLIDTYHVASLYSPSSNYTAIQLSNTLSVIGLLEIPRINLSYPILSDSNEEALKVSVCRFSRPTA